MKTTLTPQQLEKQETLTVDKLLALTPKMNYHDMITHIKSERPVYGYFQLLSWVEKVIEWHDPKYKNLQKVVNNRITIDGQFLAFAEEKNIAIECLFQDSIINWKTEQNFERFFVQGLFKITHDNMTFFQSTLFHKGNEFEDEICFACFVPSSQMEAYIKLRNEFDSWIENRDRNNQFIHVVDGEDMMFEREHFWEDLFLEQDLKNDIKSLVETFLASQEFYNKNKIPWKRGILLHGSPGCHAAGTKVVMYDGSLKNVEDVKVGDFLLGPDSTSREVLKLVQGKEEMVEITPVKGNSFVVNKNHILHLQNQELEPFNVSVTEFLSSSKEINNLNLVCAEPKKERKYYSINQIKSLGEGNYYGFTLDKDHLYMTDDFIIHHNCGKSTIIKTIIANYNFKPVTITPAAQDPDIRSAFEYAEENSPALLYFEDLDSFLEGRDTSYFLNLLDGVVSKNGLLVIATANSLKHLKDNVVNRPSRFDRKIHIPDPNEEMSVKYLTRWFKDVLTDKKIREFSKQAVLKKLSYAHLKEFYVSSIFEALSKGREKPAIKDVELVFNRIIKEKDSKSGELSLDKYLGDK